MSQILFELSEKRNVKVIHEVDATKVHKSSELIKTLKENQVDHLDKVIFNFPCVPSKSGTP